VSEVYLGIYRCPAHGYTAICVDPVDEEHGGGVRLTPGKCCGRWNLLKRWKVDAEETAQAIQNEAKAE